MDKNKMNIKKIDPDQYEIITDQLWGWITCNNIIYVTKRINPGTKNIYIYFIDVFIDNTHIKNWVDDENFDCIDLTMEYLNNNYNIPIAITNKIKKGLQNDK